MWDAYPGARFYDTSIFFPDGSQSTSGENTDAVVSSDEVKHQCLLLSKADRSFVT